MTSLSSSVRGSATFHRTTSLQDQSHESHDEEPTENFAFLQNDDCLSFARQTNDAHPGNVHFQQLVDKHASSRSSQTMQEAAQHVILEFQSRHGRFVEKLPHGAFRALSSQDCRLQDYVMNALQQATHQQTKRRSTRAKVPTKRLVDEEEFHKPSTRRATMTTNNAISETNTHRPPINQVGDKDVERCKKKSNLIYDLQDTDVISTNGGCNDLPHPGNVRFVQMTIAYGERYHKARSDTGKFAIVQEFIQEFQQTGRFLKPLGKDIYQKLPQGSIIQKVTRALKRATPPTAKTRSKGDNKTNKNKASCSLPKRTRRKRTCTIEQENGDQDDEILSSTTYVLGETRFGRKRRRVSRFQDEHEAATVAPTKTRLVKTTAELKVDPTPVKRTSRVPPKTNSTVSSRRTPNRVSPDTVPTMTTPFSKPLVLSSRGIPIVPSTPMPVVLGVNGAPHGLGLLAQRFTKWVMASKNFDYIDIDAAVKALKIPKRRIYDVINILEGAGVLQRKSEPKNVFSWVAPLRDNTQELQDALKQQDEQLDTWMNMVSSRQNNHTTMEECHISGSQLAPLVGLETSLLAVHVPRESFLRTIHTMPCDNDADPVAFKITTSTNSADSNDGKPKALPKACLLQHGETKFQPVTVKTSLSPSKAALVPYPKSPAMECHDPNPLGTLIQVLPKPPPKASLSYKIVSPGFQPIQVSDDDEEERHASPFESLWRQQQDEERRQSSPFEALLMASEAVCE